MGSLAFYALADEQRRWLATLLPQKGIWCVVRDFPWKREEIRDQADLDRLQFTREPAFDLNIGLEALGTPVWHDVGQHEISGRREIDFVKSRALRFEPSLSVDSHILLEGRIAISAPSWYEYYGVDHRPIFMWYRRVRRSLEAIMASNIAITLRLPDGRDKVQRGVRITPGAVQWRLRGGILKQFTPGPVEFDIRERL